MVYTLPLYIFAASGKLFLKCPESLSFRRRAKRELHAQYDRRRDLWIFGLSQEVKLQSLVHEVFGRMAVGKSDRLLELEQYRTSLETKKKKVNHEQRWLL